MAYGSGSFKTTYEADMALVDSRPRATALALLFAGLLALPRVATPVALELLSQVALAAIGALALHLLTGMAGQVSLGHAGFLAAGAFRVGVLAESGRPSPPGTPPATAGGRALAG